MPAVALSPAHQIEILHNLYEQDAQARAVLDHFANRERNQNVSPVRRLMANVAHEGVSLSRGQIVNVLRNLDGLGVGKFIPGRRGYESRFEWRVSSKSVGQVAAGESTEIEQNAPDSEDVSDSGSDEMIEHRFQLRPEIAVALSLPADLTEREAMRLARFIGTLPFKSDMGILPHEDFSNWEK